MSGQRVVKETARKCLVRFRNGRGRRGTRDVEGCGWQGVLWSRWREMAMGWDGTAVVGHCRHCIVGLSRGGES